MSFPDSSHPKEETFGSGPDPLLPEKQFDHVMCFGTFDIFHPGHEHYIRESQKLARRITIMVARDVRVIHGKGKKPLHTEQERLSVVKKAFPEAQVLLGDEIDIFAPIRDQKPDLLAFGYDQKVPLEKVHELFPDMSTVRIGGYETDKWKSSKLREGNTK